MRRLRMLAIGLVATAAFGVAAASATAETITISPGGSITATALSRTLTFYPGRFPIGCDLRMTATLDPGPIVAPLNTSVPIGAVTSAVPGTCSGGSLLTFLSPSTWDILGAVSATGRSVVAGLAITPFQYEIQIGGLRCLYNGEFRVSANATVTTLTVSASDTIPFSSGGILCPRPASMAGTLAASPTQTITVR